MYFLNFWMVLELIAFSLKKVFILISFCRVFKRFCEIQEDPPPKDITYEDLQQIVAKYSDLAKCPELKVRI